MKTRIPAILFGAIVLFAVGLAASGFDPREFAAQIVRRPMASGGIVRAGP